MSEKRPDDSEESSLKDETAEKPATEAGSDEKPTTTAEAKPSDAPEPATAKEEVPSAEPPKTEAPAEQPAAAPDATPKHVPFAPAKPQRRDWLLTLVPLGLLAALMSYRGDVTQPLGDDPAHPFGHYKALLHSGHIPGGIIFGIVLVLLATFGILGLLGDSPLDLRGDEVAKPKGSSLEKPWWQREGTWVVALASMLYLPMAGAYGLWDPWETHYSEVAREILSRDDWITLWWGQEGWFMSKPILIFWLAALGMGVGSAFGVPFWRDMVPGVHEWFIRVPICLFAIGAVYAVYRVVSMAWGRRAGLLSGAVLATMPHFMFLSHQAMTDMPFVAPLIIAMCFLIGAVITDPERIAQPRTIEVFGRTFRVSLWHLCMGAILVVALPQAMYLLTRPVLMGCPEEADRSCQAVLEASRIGGIQFPIERYWSGSAGNSVFRDQAASVPGSPAWEDRYNQVPFAVSFLQGIFWAGLGTILLLTFRRERREQPLRFAMLYVFSAISFMGKGPAGLGVPEIVLLGFMITTGKWKLLPRIRLFQGIGIFLVCGMPWYIGIYCRLGNEFTDRFVVHDLLNRAFAGVHGDTGTFRYFLWQLGYAMFPWTGLVPVALGGWKLWVPERASEAQKDVARLALLWFLVTFTLFSLMVTKFHHYIFPAVPSCALLVGLVLHRMLGDRQLLSTERPLVIGSLFAGVASLVLGFTNFFGAWHGEVSRTPPLELPPGNTGVAWVLSLAGVALIAFSYSKANAAEVPLEQKEGATEEGLADPIMPTLPPASVEPVHESVDLHDNYRSSAHREAEKEVKDSSKDRFVSVGLGGAGLGAVVTLALLARDIGWSGSSRPQGYERFIHLFIYNYERAFPTRSFDYHAILTGFGFVAVLAAIGLTVQKTRAHAGRMMLALAVCFGFWALDKYMIDLSNHWSQRNLFVRYRDLRRSRENPGPGEDGRYWHDPLVAFQMNWKGENFYTGNHAAMLECGLPLCRERTPDWLRRHRGQRVFIVTEHSRAGSIMGQVRTNNGTANTVTTEYDNNKFVLIEAQL